MERHSLCPGCTNCPEVIIEGDAVRIGEDANSTVLKREEWNVLVELIQSGAVVEDVAVPFAGAGPATLVRLALSKRQPRSPRRLRSRARRGSRAALPAHDRNQALIRRAKTAFSLRLF